MKQTTACDRCNKRVNRYEILNGPYGLYKRVYAECYKGMMAGTDLTRLQAQGIVVKSCGI